MITFYQCLQEYYKRPDAIKFSKKHIRSMHHLVKAKYDNINKGKPIIKKKQQEGDKIYVVRVYPREFKNVIVRLINRFHGWQTEKLNNPLEIYPSKELQLSYTELKIQELKKLTAPVISTNGEKKIRKKIPAQKPVFKAKPKNK